MNKGNIFKNIPSVDNLMSSEEMSYIKKDNSRELILFHVRESIDFIKKDISKNPEYYTSFDKIKFKNDIIKKVKQKIDSLKEMNLKPLVNATGVVLHTNLGRAIIDNDLKDIIWETISNYSNLEFDLSTGKRGTRYDSLVDIIKYLTKAEDVLVVNNNAAAVMLTLSSMCKGGEVIVSRGELVEIGGSFRVPDIMKESGCELVEVGTTNKTHLRDYENAINENTSAILKVHTSNYKILGFTKEVKTNELKELSTKKNIPLIEDLGSGILIDLSEYGIKKEPTVLESINDGIDIVTFSGDKLLGSCQAGIIVGKKAYIDKMKKNPLTRAFRIDKMSLITLEATLKKYLKSEDINKSNPTLKMITDDYEYIEKKAIELKYKLEQALPNLNLSIKSDYSMVGGGSLPDVRLKTAVIVIKHNNISFIEKQLRSIKRPIIGRVKDDSFILDLRTIKLDDFEYILKGFKEIEI